MPPADPASPWAAEVDGVTALAVRLTKPVRWRLAAGGERLEVAAEPGGEWRQAPLALAGIFEGLDAGEPLHRLVARVRQRAPELPAEHARAAVVAQVIHLWKRGHVAIDLPPLPRVFAGQYERVRELGRGGVGVVWLCRDLAAQGREVAVKHAWNYAASLPRAEAALREEGAVLAKLHHPGLAWFLAEFESEGRYHLVREYVDGTRLGSTRGLPEAERRRAAAEVAALLGYIHGQGYAFLDIQPDNFFLVGPGQRVQCADAGLCRPFGPPDPARANFVGARGYIAPELLKEGASPTVRSDICSLGRLYYALAMGQPPAQSSTGAALAEALRAAGKPAFDGAFVAACCADAPAARPASMAEVERWLLTSRT